MKIAFFGAKPYDRKYFDLENAAFGHEIVYYEAHLDAATASLAHGCEAVCAFVNDELDRAALTELGQCGVKAVALRCAGFNNVDLVAAKDLGLLVTRVPEYSPFGVAEHAVAMALALNRKICRAYNRVREGNFALEGLLGFNVNGKTVGVVGTGKIGAIFCRIMLGFGCRVVAFDPYSNDDCARRGVAFVSFDELLQQSDIISLHCPLTPSSRYLINDAAVGRIKRGAMLINTSRGALVDTLAVIKGLKSGQIGYLGLDVYEEEADLFFEDNSGQIMGDDVFARLLTFPNVLITGHQAFFTDSALRNIAVTTLTSLKQIEDGEACPCLVG